MLARWGIRFASSLIGIAVGLILASAVLSSFSISFTALVEATLIFWLVHVVVQVIALKVLVRQPSVALAGLLALAATIISLIIVNAIVSGMHIHGVGAYIPAALIIWITTALADTLGRRQIKEQRRDN
jgi:Mycobacterial 4 TMS phage holin, superfamily IV